MLRAQQEEMPFFTPDFTDLLAGLGSPQPCCPPSLLVPWLLPYPETYLSATSFDLILTQGSSQLPRLPP